MRQLYKHIAYNTTILRIIQLQLLSSERVLFALLIIWVPTHFSFKVRSIQIPKQRNWN